MILEGFSCPHCDAHILDSVTECVRCNTPYPEEIAKVAREHHAMKMRMVARTQAKPEEVAEAETLLNVRELGRFAVNQAHKIERSENTTIRSDFALLWEKLKSKWVHS